ncbi:MAG TPA: hypothetical protein VK142_03925 [Bacillota bacterium]|nr:hypothetical protein [Bacillota bacterium]
MVRSLIGFLIIAVIFLAGMAVGGGQDKHQSFGESIKLIDFNPDLQTEEDYVEKINMREKHQADIETPDQEVPEGFIQTAASSLESVVKGFYDMIVQLCYAFANLFF